MQDKNKKARIKALTSQLSEAAKAYYDEDREIMPNIEYDKLYDELAELEQETGFVMAGSPTMHVGYEVASELPKETHETPLLSLDKTKDPGALSDWLGHKQGLLSWKLDGVTIALTYKNGELSKAVTRGNGQVGEIVTGNAKTFTNVPLKIKFDGELVVRGEAVISYSDFEKINEEIDDIELRYKNPRNLVSGSVRQLSSSVTAKRHVQFFAFALVKADGGGFQNSRAEQMDFLDKLGFQTVEHFIVDKDGVGDRIKWFSTEVKKNNLPSDGLVLTYDDMAYGASLGRTSKFPRDSIAFKWEDELRETVLIEIEWSTSRTGLINPIAIFEPVELEGTTVSRASVHNISILEELQLGIGDKITVYKANMIIPQVAENLTKSGPVEIPASCPVCGGKTAIKNENGVKFLFCTNEGCEARQIKKFTHFVQRNAMNIEGLSEATLEKFIGKGYLHEFADIFKLEKYEEEIVAMDGFGEKSFQNLMNAISSARNTTQVRLLFSLGISNFGLANAKIVCRACGYDWDKITRISKEELLEIDGIGEVMADAYTEYFSDEKNWNVVENLRREVTFMDMAEPSAEQIFEGKTFVITGSLEHFPNRNALKEAIEELGGKVAGSVSAKTDYLVNNDRLSSSSKNKKAKELNVAIIDEQQLSSWMDGGKIHEER